MIHDEPNLFRLLISSLCPGIFGHELVKAGLLLSLFGGTVQNEGVISRRSDINMLMIGVRWLGDIFMYTTYLPTNNCLAWGHLDFGYINV